MVIHLGSPFEDVIDRMAKALIVEIGSPWTWDKMDAPRRELWRNHARAAFSAMVGRYGS